MIFMGVGVGEVGQVIGRNVFVGYTGRDFSHFLIYSGIANIFG